MENNTPPQQELTLTDQEKRQLENYKGERGRRGNRLPKGFQKVSGLIIAGA